MISSPQSSQNADFGYKITVIPLYQNDGYSLVEHTAQRPTAHPVVQNLDLHKLGRIGCGSLPLVEMVGLEPMTF